MEDNNNLSLDYMRKQRSRSQAVFMQFVSDYRDADGAVFCFYEGEDAKYYNPRIREYIHAETVQYAVGSKKDVINLCKLLRASGAYNQINFMFFIDRDMDSPESFEDKDMYVTDGYSIENYYVQNVVFENIIKTEFNLNANDLDYIKCLNDYIYNLSIFNKVMATFNALLKYKNMYCGSSIVCQFQNYKLSDFITFNIFDGVSKSDKCDGAFNDIKCLLNINAPLFEKMEKLYQNIPEPQFEYRGKNQLDFLVLYLKELKCNATNKRYFSKRLERVYLNITNNRLSELSQYAITPHSLVAFLQRHDK